MKKQGFMIKEVTMIQINFQSWESKRKGVICGTYFKFPECTEKNSFGAVVGAAQIMDAVMSEVEIEESNVSIIEIK